MQLSLRVGAFEIVHKRGWSGERNGSTSAEMRYTTFTEAYLNTIS